MKGFFSFNRMMIFALVYAALIFPYYAFSQSDSEKKQKIENMISEFSPGGSVFEIDAAAAMTIFSEKNVVFLDVRNEYEMSVSIIPGAITKKSFEENQILYKNSNIIAYCTIGYRSAKYVERWNKKGFYMRNLRGSLLLWSHAGGPLIDSEGKPTRRVHVNGKKWNLVPSTYQGVY
jgi:rhodanese-related sulfurtransferase